MSKASASHVKKGKGRPSRTKRSNIRASFGPTVNMDNKQRICLTRVLTRDEKDLFSSFRVYREGGKIVLEPVVSVPEKDHWIYKDPEALASLMRGIRDAEEGRVHDLGSFAEYAAKDE